ncbi:MAG TPA: recombinase-like helix-turn-helix domain-containing protein [Stellaceae bacterium]|nr:recombinase-like helix-turn-helix domain-containing protein [Stellaceae bacterium]
MTEATDNLSLGFDPRIFTTDPVELAYVNALADGLERVLEGGAETLEAIVAGLNQRHVTTKSGMPWTAAALAAELERLGR